VINVFIRNLDPTTTKEQVKDLFAALGSVENDCDTNGPRGLAFVEMTNATEAKSTIESLNGFALNDRAMKLNEGRSKPEHDSARDSSREDSRHRI
jgi:RNA recognition motif-containing protein